MAFPGDPPPQDGETKEEVLKEAIRLRDEEGKEAAALEAGPVRSLLLFSLGSECYAVDLLHVRRVLRPLSYARVPGVGPEILGLMNCHGEVLCVLDMRKVLKVPTEADEIPGKEPLVVILQLGGREAGFLVDSVDDVWDVPASAVLPVLESLEPARAKMFDGTVSREGRFVGLLNVAMCLNP